MDFFTTATTTYALTDEALDLINFFSQLLTVSFAILFGLLSLIILIIIFKS
jgi:hypothetical protein